MALLERLKGKDAKAPKPTEGKKKADAGVVQGPSPEATYQELKSRVHNRLFEALDLQRLSKVSEERIRQDVALATQRILEEEKVLLTLDERDRFVREIQDEVFGLGPLEPLLADPSVSDILVNGHQQIYVERRGRLEATSARFKDDTHLMRIIEKIVSAVGRRVDEVCPMVDARLADGSRVNAIIPPLALDGAAVSIRRFGSNPLKLEDLLNFKAFTPEMVMLLEGAMKARLNIVISGGTGSGKTTLLNTLSSFIPNDQRVITIEDA